MPRAGAQAGGAWGWASGRPPEGAGSQGGLGAEAGWEPAPGAQPQQLSPPHSAEALTLGLGLSPGVRPASSLQGEPPGVTRAGRRLASRDW